MRPVTSPIVNRFFEKRFQRFNPLPSGRDQPDRLNYVEAFAGVAPPEVLSRTVPIVGASAPFAPLTPSEMIEVLQLTLPVPMPIGVTLGAYAVTDINDRFRTAARFSAVAEGDGIDRARGRYIIEWGYGKARNYAFTDLAPGSLQIPIADSLKISAHAYGDDGSFTPGALFCLAGASAYPGSVTKNPSATYTLNATAQLSDPLTVGTIVPPFARRFSAGLIGLPGLLRGSVSMGDINGLALATWNMIAPNLPGVAIVATEDSRPYGIEDVVMPGGANTIAFTLWDVQDVLQAGYCTLVIQL